MEMEEGGAHLLSLRLATRSLRVPTNDNRPRRKSVNIRLADKQGVYISETRSRIIRDKNRLKCLVGDFSLELFSQYK